MNTHVASVGPLETSVRDDGAVEVRTSLRLGARVEEVWWRVRGAEVRARPEAAFAALLQPAMSLGLDIELTDGLAGRLQDALPELISIYRSFDPHLAAIEVRAPQAEPHPKGDGVGLCFSLGVDGFHSLVQHLDEVTHLVLIHGLDYEVDAPLAEVVGAQARGVAEATGKTLVEIWTNQDRVVATYDLSRRMTAGQAALGASLASAAMLLGPSLGRLYVPSSATAATLVPFGSHPLVDPLWSIDTLDVVHDAIGVDRIDKIANIIDFEPAWTSLRVCGTNPGGAYNCGRCMKCSFTMFMLASLGALERFRTLPPSFEDAFEDVWLRLNLRPTPGMWYASLTAAVGRMDAQGRDARRMRKILRSSSFLGRQHRRQMRRRIRRILRRHSNTESGA